MCGIFGYVGTDGRAINSVLNSIGLLEHRGYDSMGVVFVIDGEVELYKISQEDKENFNIEDLKQLVPDRERICNSGIGHTRWATFGGKTTKNAHPHYDFSRLFYFVHNGNVENLSDIKNELGDCSFYSETDSEAIVNLIAKYFKETSSLEKATRKTLKKIEGANAFVVMDANNPEQLIAANKGGTIILGKYNGNMVVASDLAAFESFAVKNKHILKDNEIVVVNKSGWKIFEDEKVKKAANESNGLKSGLGEYGFYMEKEIFEQKHTMTNTIRGRLISETGIPKLGGIENIARNLRKVKTFHFIGCGTAYNACFYATFLFNRFGIDARAWIASEFCYRHPVIDPDDAFIFISQSGETADTIEVINEIKTKGNVCLGIVNVPGSRIWRETDAGISIRAGKEKGVASTKAFISQLASVVMLAVFLARQRKMTINTGQRILRELELIPDKIQEILDQADSIKKVAIKYSQFLNYYFLGRYFNYITAEEGSLKLKEISYVHAEAYPLGEMKHGPLALIDKDFCSVVIMPNDSVFKKSLVSIHEIKARNGKVLAITNKKMDVNLADDIIFVPETIEYLSPLLTTIPLQLFSYYMALNFKCNPDKPRNLAKTVTVS